MIWKRCLRSHSRVGRENATPGPSCGMTSSWSGARTAFGDGGVRASRTRCARTHREDHGRGRVSSLVAISISAGSILYIVPSGAGTVATGTSGRCWVRTGALPGRTGVSGAVCAEVRRGLHHALRQRTGHQRAGPSGVGRRGRWPGRGLHHRVRSRIVASDVRSASRCKPNAGGQRTCSRIKNLGDCNTERVTTRVHHVRDNAASRSVSSYCPVAKSHRRR
jgi:hypothetical protein